MRILRSIARDSKVLIMADARINKKRSFDAAFKLMVVEYAEMNTNRGAATKYSVNDKQVRMKKEDLKDLPKKKKRIDGGGRKPRLPDVETVLMAWIDELRAGHLRITCSEIQRKATELARNEGDTEFIASRGWLQKFFKRHQLSLRTKTSVSQKLPQDLMPKVLFLVFKTSMLYIAPMIVQVVGFITKTRKLRLLKQYSLGCIGNMDETPLWMDMPGETTVSRAGERTLSIRTTGHDKGRFTVVLAAMADGKKLKPYVVFKGVRPVAELARIPGVVVAYSRNGWMNEELTKDWVSRPWGLLAFNQRLLVWDAYKCHITDAITSYAKRSTKTDVSIIPGGLTRHLQPADVSWNKPFKEA